MPSRTYIGFIAGFFLTPAAEKTKTQAQNSREKLKEKTQPQGGTCLLLRETQEKTQFNQKKSKTRKVFKGVPLFMPFLLTNLFKYF